MTILNKYPCWNSYVNSTVLELVGIGSTVTNANIYNN
jgi:hypothetical protein